jgi:hypothetical protein
MKSTNGASRGSVARAAKRKREVDAALDRIRHPFEPGTSPTGDTATTTVSIERAWRALQRELAADK